MYPRNSAEAAPSPERRPSIKIESIVFNEQEIPIDNLGQNVPPSIREKFTYQGKPRRLLIAASIDANSDCEGDSLVAQFIFANSLRAQNLIKEGALVGGCILQRHTLKIKKFAYLAKNIAKKIRETWGKVDKEIIESDPKIQIDKLIDQLTTIGSHREGQQRAYALNRIRQIKDKLETIKLQFQSNKKSVIEIDKILAITQAFNAMIEYEATIKTLSNGNNWGNKTKEKMQEYLDEADIMPIIRWPDIYKLLPNEFGNIFEYQEYIKQSLATYKNFHGKNTLFTDMESYTADVRNSYVARLTDNLRDNLCKKVFDDSVKYYLQHNNNNKDWETNIGYSTDEIQKACLDYLIEECAWIAYMAENYPDVLIMYPGPLLPAIRWTFENFHPKKEVCFIQVNVTQSTHLKNKGDMKPGQKNSHVKEEPVGGSPNNEISIFIDPNGAVSMKYNGPLPPQQVMRDFRETFRDLKAAETSESPPKPKQSSGYYCTLL